MTIADLKRLRAFLLDEVLDSFAAPPVRITLDLDAFDDETYGQQQLGLTDTFGFSMNARLQRETQALLDQAVRQYNTTQQKQRLFQCFEYQADSWPQSRTVIVQCEAHAAGTNRRAIVTDRPGANVLPQGTYDEYVLRGESENRNKELKDGLHADRLIKVAVEVVVSCRRVQVTLSSSWPHAGDLFRLARQVVLAGRPRHAARPPLPPPLPSRCLDPTNRIAHAGEGAAAPTPTKQLEIQPQPPVCE